MIFRQLQKRAAAVLVLALVSGPISACGSDDDSGGTNPPVASLEAQLIQGGFDHPLLVTAPPGDNTRLFVVERTGKIRVIKDGTLLPTPFLDIGAKVHHGSEQGLLGMTFAPDYATSHAFYLDYVDPAVLVKVSRFHAPSAGSDVADTAEQFLIGMQQADGAHNGGMVVFGPDGFLYVSTGDGHCCDDPDGRGQDRTELLGSMLRIDVSGNGAYTVPASNPYATHGTFAHELWNYGLRNPWRFSFDRVTGDLYIGDVGEGSFEEVNILPAGSTGGENLGWRLSEGPQCWHAQPCDQSGVTLPKLFYEHNEGCAIMGGYVYRGSAIPSLRGTYFYADFCTGFVRSFKWTGGQVTSKKEYTDFLPANSQPNSFGEDASGELYITTEGGELYQIVEQ